MVTVFTKYTVECITVVREIPYDRILLLGTKNIQFSTVSILIKHTLDLMANESFYITHAFDKIVAEFDMRALNIFIGNSDVLTTLGNYTK